MIRLRVYFDTNLVSRIRDSRLADADATALERLSEFSHRIHYLTSDLLTNEVARSRDPKTRGALLFLAAIVDKVPWHVNQLSGAVGAAPIGCLPVAGDWVDPVYEGLRDLFDPTDAHHIFLAVRNECDYFLTLDRGTIVTRALENPQTVARLCGPLKVVDPPRLLDSVRQASASS